jgi:hypothetical protein
MVYEVNAFQCASDYVGWLFSFWSEGTLADLFGDITFFPDSHNLDFSGFSCIPGTIRTLPA